MSFVVKAQSDFKKGYYITVGGQKIECLVNSSTIFETKIEIKKTEKDPVEYINNSTLDEINVEDKEFYVVRDVTIDANRKKPSDDSAYATEVEVVLTEKRLVIKKLVDGSKSLYATYVDEVPMYFLHNLENKKIEYLVYNEYRLKNATKQNESYKRQLLRELSCTCFKGFERFEYLRYTASDLTKLFVDYNNCNGSLKENLTIKEDKNKFGLSVIGGVKQVSAKFSQESLFYSETISESTITPSFGLEVNYNIKKFDLFLRASYDKISIDKTVQTPIPSGVSTVYEIVKYSASHLNLGVGVRNYFVNENKYKLYFDGAIEFTKPFNSETFAITSTTLNLPESAYYNLKTNSDVSASFGLGIVFGKKYGAEIRYFLPKNLHQKSSLLSSNISGLSLNLIYKII